MHLLIMVMLTAVALSMAPTTRNIQPHLCGVAARATETVAPGVMLTWDSAITCADVVEQGDFEIAINIEAAADNARAARIETLSIVATAPRPRNQGPQITANPVNLPLELDPGQTATLAVEGAYELIVTGEGGKAVLVLRASGGNDEPMQLGVSVQFLAPGVSPEEDSAEAEPGEGDPPPWAGGPPEWAGSGPPPWAGGPDEDADPSDLGDDAVETEPDFDAGPPPWADAPCDTLGSDDGPEDADRSEDPPAWAGGPPGWAGSGPPPWADGPPQCATGE
jgi:hypothetical protein